MAPVRDLLARVPPIADGILTLSCTGGEDTARFWRPPQRKGLIIDSPQRIAVLGPLPPPFGGVSVHVLREIELLRQCGHLVEILPYSGLPPGSVAGRAATAVGRWGRAAVRLLAARHDLIHLHYSTSGYQFAIDPILAAQRGRIVMTLHAVRVIHDHDRMSRPARAALRRNLARAALLICVRAEIAELLAERRLVNSPVLIQPAFLPPAGAEADLQRLPEPLRAALAADDASGRATFTASAYYLGPGYGREDLYGLEHLVLAFAFAESGCARPWSLRLLVSNRPAGGEQWAAEARILQAAAGMRQGRVEIHYGVPLVPVLARSLAFVRPSREDGDSVAVREAMAMGLPVLASDVVRRPEGTTLFHVGSPEDSAPALAGFLNTAGEVGSRCIPVAPPDAARLAGFISQLTGASRT